MKNLATDASQSIPEILAPVGGREQFFAALYSGADAVFLGLKQFNARARADNFTTDDLKELLPLAHRYGMKVLVTLNILIKQIELPQLIETLAALERLQVDAIIVQDAGVVRLVREHFPMLRLHASTQFAVHSAAGAVFAHKMGFKRIVLAREMTAQEIRIVRTELPKEVAEIESFCHGSLCYSYSGLCFFSGAADARSGNRGECAYTCRKPYKILSEPGHGFLFSMKDLNTVQELHHLVDAGVDTLKIEGRKKDAQYVSTSVGMYRNKLDELFGRKTLRALAPTPAQSMSYLNIQDDAKFSFQREGTSLFVKGRYHENVIDLDNPGHKGVLVGKIQKLCAEGFVQILLSHNVDRFDGIKVMPAEVLFHAVPQHGSEVLSESQDLEKRYSAQGNNEFSIREMQDLDGRWLPTARAGQLVKVLFPQDYQAKIGDGVFKTRSADLKARIEQISKPTGNDKLVPFESVCIELFMTRESELLKLKCRALALGQAVLTKQFEMPFQEAKQISQLEADLIGLFSIWGDEGLSANDITVTLDSASKIAFAPKSKLKQWKKEFGQELKSALDQFYDDRKNAARLAVLGRASDLGSQSIIPLTRLDAQSSQVNIAATGKAALSVKVDRLETLQDLCEFFRVNHQCTSETLMELTEIVFEPKRAFLPLMAPEALIQKLQELQFDAEKSLGRSVTLRLALPTVIRAWDEAVLKKWVQAALLAGLRAFEVGNVGAIELLHRWSASCEVPADALNLCSDFTLYALNNLAVLEWSQLGISKQALSIENDWQDLKLQAKAWPSSGPLAQVILYKDTPLFVAESCSLTALHNGCPTAKVCGYRTLEIENEEGERFFVAHESCKSVVYAKEAFCISHRTADFVAAGVKEFKVDFLTRPYDRNELGNILSNVICGLAIESTHAANLNRRLL